MSGRAKLKLWLTTLLMLLSMVCSAPAGIVHIDIGVNSAAGIVFLQIGGLVGDLTGDGVVDVEDVLTLSDWWLWVGEAGEIPEDITADGTVDFNDFSILAIEWRQELPQTPPTPNPMTWAVEPYATSPYSIAMVATTATSTDGSGVEYYFEDFDYPEYNSGWLSFGPDEEARWVDTGLAPEVTCRYRAKAHNKSNLLETDWSPIRSAKTLPPPDTTPPTPNPMQWASGGEPKEVDHGGGTWDYWAEMTAAQATDGSGGVQYYFECTSDSRYSSGGEGDPGGTQWRIDRTYMVLVGQKDRNFWFRVYARDLYENQTEPSSQLPAD